MTHKRILIKLS